MHPAHLRSLQSIGRAGRTISFDHRGSGSSDPIDDVHIGNLDDAVTDILRVLGAAGCDRVAMLAEVLAVIRERRWRASQANDVFLCADIAIVDRGILDGGVGRVPLGMRLAGQSLRR